MKAVQLKQFTRFQSGDALPQPSPVWTGPRQPVGDTALGGWSEQEAITTPRPRNKERKWCHLEPVKAGAVVGEPLPPQELQVRTDAAPTRHAAPGRWGWGRNNGPTSASAALLSFWGLPFCWQGCPMDPVKGGRLPEAGKCGKQIVPRKKSKHSSGPFC